MSIQNTILVNLLVNEDYLRKVIPHLQIEYFQGEGKELFIQICNFVDKYNHVPTKVELAAELSKNARNEEHLGKLFDYAEIIFAQNLEDVSTEWLIDQTEEFCKTRALENAIIQSFDIIEGREKNLRREAIPSLVEHALMVSFDTTVGHDFLEDARERYQYFNQDTVKIPFGISDLDAVTEGGVEPETLNVLLAGTGVGKTLFMSQMASNLLLKNYNVLYITFEIMDKKIAQRMEASLLDENINKIYKTKTEDEFVETIEQIKNKSSGKLIIHQYPTSGAHVGHIRILLNELRIKKKFKPHIIFVDYLNIMASERVRMGGNISAYGYVKSIVEELRGLAVNEKLAVFTATQATRSGSETTNLELSDTSESWGTPVTADYMFGLTATEEWNAEDKILCIQLKSRYNDVNERKKFFLGIDRAKQQIYSLDASGQEGL